MALAGSVQELAVSSNIEAVGLAKSCYNTFCCNVRDSMALWLRALVASHTSRVKVGNMQGIVVGL